MGLNRREFVKLCSGTVAGLGISQVFNPKVIQAMEEGAKKAPVIWIQGQGCTGCSVSLLNSVHPKIKDVLLKVISLEYHPTLMAAEGDLAIEHMYEVAEKFQGKFFLIVEGAIPTKADGRFCIVGEKDGHEITMKDLALDLGKKSLATVAVGTCAAYGGIPAAQGNLTGATGVKDVFSANGLGDKLVVNVPGCPPHPDWMIGTLLAAWQYALGKGPLPDLDGDGRPTLFFGENIHENCPYLDKFDNDELAENFMEKDKCRYMLGCKGPYAYADCFKRRWNGGVNWCVENAICIGCVEPGFPDGMSPLYQEG
ncbi:NiFeSe hydrogenase small subunit [Desulfoplanes sp.]